MLQHEQDGMRPRRCQIGRSAAPGDGQDEPEERISRAGGARTAASPDDGGSHGFIKRFNHSTADFLAITPVGVPRLRRFPPRPWAGLAGEERPSVLRERFDQYFEIVCANTPELLRIAHSIRYQVYCVERAFESDEHRNGLEIDPFDERAIHSLIIHRASGEAAGTVRLIRPDQRMLKRSFSFQQLVEPAVLEGLSCFPVRSMAEISRFSISKTFRGRARNTLGDESVPPSRNPCDDIERRRSPLMRLGLMQAVVAMSRTLGISHWCAVMEPTLLRILSATAMGFESVGPLVNYHGLRQPCYGDIGTILKRLRARSAEAWDLITVGGSLCEGTGWMDAEPLRLDRT
jgi:N-acyl amino acid synthase of PEP-CTERM/exosortase system